MTQITLKLQNFSLTKSLSINYRLNEKKNNDKNCPKECDIIGKKIMISKLTTIGTFKCMIESFKLPLVFSEMKFHRLICL
jgi:hypothetical protein